LINCNDKSNKNIDNAHKTHYNTYNDNGGAEKMSQTTNINIRMDVDLKKQAEKLFNEFGMNMTTAFTIFTKAVVRERKIPFEISAKDDGFYNEYNQAILKKSIKELSEGKGKKRELIKE